MGIARIYWMYCRMSVAWILLMGIGITIWILGGMWHDGASCSGDPTQYKCPTYYNMEVAGTIMAAVCLFLFLLTLMIAICCPYCCCMRSYQYHHPHYVHSHVDHHIEPVIVPHVHQVPIHHHHQQPAVTYVQHF